MKIGLIVDGEAEFRSLVELYDRLDTPHILLRPPLRADIQPLAPVPQIVGAVKSRLLILLNRGADMIVVLVDRENRDVCPGKWAGELTTALNAAYTSIEDCQLTVVVKNSCYENWLISDPEAFTKIRKRFQISQSVIRSISPNKADHVNAQAILKSAAQGNAYSKITDAVHIMKHANPSNMALNSRSFRRFLRQIEHPAYNDQSRNPAS